MTDIQKNLAYNMKVARSKIKISQQQLAEKCSVSTSYIGEIEIGRKFPSANTLDKISKALSLKPYQLFFDQSDWNSFDKNSLLVSFSTDLKNVLQKDINNIIKKYN